MPRDLCQQCAALCCRRFAVPIVTPVSDGDFDDIRWYLLHKGVELFVDKGKWFISIDRPCIHITPDNRCAIYTTRPRVCRAYKTASCEYHDADFGFDLHFTTAEALAEYAAGLRRQKRAPRSPTADKPRSDKTPARPKSSAQRSPTQTSRQIREGTPR